jgi:hypothetical protein
MARRKIDKGAAERAAALVDDELPDLTEKEQKFLEGLLQYKPATVAYREAFDCSNMLDTSIQVAASRLRHSSKMRLWFSAAKKAYLGTAVVTLDSHVRELDRIKEIALETGNVGAAAQCEQLRGKATGLYVDKFEDVTPSEPVKLLRDMLQYFPEIVPAITERVARPVPIDLTSIDAKAEPVDDEGESGR